MADAFGKWTCIFPGKMGLAWKRAWYGEGTKEEAETQAAKNCNVIAVPVQLAESIRGLYVKIRQLNETISDITRSPPEPTGVTHG